MTFVAPNPLDLSAAIAVVDESVDEPIAACDVCEHPASAHDPISLRYCKATMSSSLARHCICRS
jgi:hypothetical protein